MIRSASGAEQLPANIEWDRGATIIPRMFLDIAAPF